MPGRKRGAEVAFRAADDTDPHVQSVIERRARLGLPGLGALGEMEALGPDRRLRCGLRRPHRSMNLMPGPPRTVGILLRRPCQHGAMATIEELLRALDERLLDAIGGKSTPEGVAKLAEARAWLTNPDQPHGSTVTS
jgi:hypothetical protein